MLSIDERQNTPEEKPTQLTTEELRKYEGFENMSDEELELHVTGIRRLASIVLNIYLSQHHHE